jgi:hypothetical protein
LINSTYLFFKVHLSSLQKTQHINDLQVLIDKLIIKENAYSINKSYLDNDIIPEYLMNFPECRFKDDPIYVRDFKRMINEFQVKILKFNSFYFERKKDEINIEIKNKIEFISKFDNSIDSKLSILKAEAIKNHKKQLQIANEKILKLINKTHSNRTNNNSTRTHTTNLTYRNNSKRSRFGNNRSNTYHTNTRRLRTNNPRYSYNFQGPTENNYYHSENFTLPLSSSQTLQNQKLNRK